MSHEKTALEQIVGAINSLTLAVQELQVMVRDQEIAHEFIMGKLVMAKIVSVQESQELARKEYSPANQASVIARHKSVPLAN